MQAFVQGSSQQAGHAVIIRLPDQLCFNSVQEDFLKGEEVRPPGEQKALPRPPPQMRQALPTDPQAVAEFNASMAAYYHQVLPIDVCPSAYQDKTLLSVEHASTWTSINQLSICAPFH